MLHPSFKLGYFEAQNAPPGWVEKATNDLRAAFSRYCDTILGEGVCVAEDGPADESELCGDDVEVDNQGPPSSAGSSGGTDEEEDLGRRLRAQTVCFTSHRYQHILILGLVKTS